ncbi:MAG: type IX secretion system PorP/SprF family membrane protein [Saprospiraceae bacterium]|jgi:type IX secretion system PorP/SprF family membrane protein
MNRLLLPLFIILLFSINCEAQQYPLFSHYALNSLGFNPAIAGSTDCPEARLVYRNQWTGLNENPETAILSGQGRLKTLPLGIGGYFYNDEAGKLKRTGGSLALSFAKKLDSLTTVTVGMGAGMYNVRLRNDYNAETNEDQTIMNGLNGMWVSDFSAGLYLQRKGLYVGFSVPQIFEPQLKFDEEDLSQNELVRHYYGMVGYKMRINREFAVEPSALVKAVKNTPLQWEGTARVFWKNMLWVGGTYRSDKTVAALVGATLNDKMTLAYAYDMATSNLNKVSNGSHEITLGYRFCKSKDSDGDGVMDKDDKCPEVPGPSENDGCPDESVADNDDDRDKDGISDALDKCPDLAGSLANSGCPIDDRDKDGIVDNKDKCPDLAGPFATGGCPGEDTDKDGIVDELDQCPTEPGPLYLQGCPPVASASVVTKEIREAKDIAIRNVYFDLDKDNIKRQYFQDLDKLAEYLVGHPEWRVRATGHTDERASKEYNDSLSKRRVESVMFYLMNRGAKRNQIVAEYYGEGEPSEIGTTEANYQLNRRVELNLLFE